MEREKMNLPVFRPNPPFLLGSLAGASKGSAGAPLKKEEPAFSPALQPGLDLGLEEALTAEAPEAELDDTYQLEPSPKAASAETAVDLSEPIELSTKASESERAELFPEEKVEELSIELDDFAIEAPEPGPARPEQASEEEIVLDMDLSDSEAASTEGPPLLDASEPEDDSTFIELEPISQDEPEVTVKEELFEDAEEPLDLGKVASAIEDSPEHAALSGETAGAEESSLSEVANIPPEDTVTLEREFLGLDLELEPLEGESEAGQPETEEVLADEMVLDTDLSGSEEIQTLETPVLDTSEAEVEPPLVIESDLKDEPEITLDEELLVDLEEPLDLGKVASEAEEGPRDVGPLPEPPKEEPLASDEGAYLPDGDALTLDRELLGLDLELEPSEGEAEISEDRPGLAFEDETAKEPLASDEGAHRPRGDTLALDQEVSELDIELESSEGDAEISEAQPVQALEDEIALGDIDEPLDLGVLGSPLEEEEPSQPSPLGQGFSPDDTMALDLEALGLDLELEPEEPERRPT